ncbi:hypothetical protein DYB32_010854, partial [Aphanomyces invadans]
EPPKKLLQLFGMMIATWPAWLALSLVSGLVVPPRVYQCKDNLCVQEAIAFTANGTSLSICELTCGDGSLWPKPTKHQDVGRSVQPISIASITHSVTFLDHTNYNSALAPAMQAVFHDVLETKANECTTPDTVPEFFPVSISATITTADEVNMTASPHVSITATTVYGYRHALTTLSQLMEYDELSHTMQIVETASIRDAPAFPHRGITLDTSRNFYSIGAIKRVLDGMGMNKAKVQVYTQADIRELVQYAKVRGIRVIPELDAPAHVGAGWQWGPDAGLGDLVVCFDHLPWQAACVQPPCGQLNPMNPEVYSILDTVYAEFATLFDADVLHMGGDEVHVGCWNMTDAITQGMPSRESTDFVNVWGQFQVKAAQLAMAHATNRKIMLWTSDLTHTSVIQRYLPPGQYVIQNWDATTTNSTATLAALGYHVVLSNYDKWYLDCGHGNWLTNGTSWCDPLKSWQVLYDVDMHADLPPELHQFVLGGEGRHLFGVSCMALFSRSNDLPLAALWSELADEHSAEVKLWPRSAASAERLWTNPSTSWKEAYGRLQRQRNRMMQAGLHADAMQPQWCQDHPSRCTLL